MNDFAPQIIGLCPLCGREMWAGPSVDRHHFVPKSQGGAESEYLHKICHRKLHSMFTEKELAREFSTAEAVREHPEIQKFLKFLRHKPPDFYDRHARHKQKGKRDGTVD
jgi:hypothetical protein